MIKRIIIALSMLVIIIVSLIGYQWFLFEKNEKETTRVQDRNLEVEATIVHKSGQLSITQKTSSLVQSSFLVKLPAHLQNFQCVLPNEKKCEILEEEKYKRVDVGNASTVTFTYHIPIAANKEFNWIDDVFVDFFRDDEKIIMANFKVSLSEEEDKAIKWIAGAANKVEVDKKHLSYFAWTKRSAVEFPLYMTKTPIHQVDTYEPNLSLFVLNSGKEEDFTSFQNWYEQLPTNSGLTIVQADHDKLFMAPLFVVVPSTYPINHIEELALEAYLLHYKQPETNDIKWVWRVLPSLILDRPVGTGKESEMSEDLVQNLKPEARTAFSTWLLDQSTLEKKFTLTDLDHQLSLASNLQTTYFAKNEDENKKATPLYYFDDRPVFNNEGLEINKDWNAVERNKMVQFPFAQTMESLGYSVKFFPESKLYLLSKGGNSWRFYLTETYYIFNQENYGLTNRPLELLGEDVYISERWLEELLKIEVVKRDDGIYLR